MEKKEKQIDQLLAEYDYFEEKNLSMSPKHALNNLLQEEKMIYPVDPWPPIGPEWVKTGGTANRENAQLNMPFVCKSQEFKNWNNQDNDRISSGITPESLGYEELCQQNGETELNLLRYILSNKLGYNVKQIDVVAESDDSLKGILEDPTLLGIIINVGGHFAAIANGVITFNPSLNTEIHAYMEPYYQVGPIYLRTDDTIRILKNRAVPQIIEKAAGENGNPIVQDIALIVYLQPEAYSSVAAKRIRLRNQQQIENETHVRQADAVVNERIVSDIDVNPESIQTLVKDLKQNPQINHMMNSSQLWNTATQLLYSNGNDLERARKIAREMYNERGGKLKKKTKKNKKPIRQPKKTKRKQKNKKKLTRKQIKMKTLK
jgi:hypothetical protein